MEKPDIVSDQYSDTDYSTNDPKEVAKFMEKHHLTEEDLTNDQDYFLYEKVLTDWFEHNPKSRFSLDHLGKVDIIQE
ncbi:MAG TPA: TipC family immunity protein [Bacillota bacterium]|nr:TipC family immunity protein [Bacillota bacterium]